MNKWVRRILLGIGALLALVLLVAGVLMLIGTSRFNHQYAITAHALPPADDSSMAHGRYLAVTRGCTECHGANLGGTLLINDGMFAVLPAPNLTKGPGGAAATFTDADWEKAIRHGVRQDGKTLLIMPSAEFTSLTDADVRALITYISAQPPVDDTLPARRIGPIPRLLVGAGAPLPLGARQIDHTAPHPSVKMELSAAYGAHVAKLCQGCHGANFEGSTGGPTPAPPLNASGHVPKWTEEQFLTTLRTGTTPEGKHLDPAAMPWKVIGQANDTELRSVYRYLRTLR